MTISWNWNTNKCLFFINRLIFQSSSGKSYQNVTKTMKIESEPGITDRDSRWARIADSPKSFQNVETSINQNIGVKVAERGHFWGRQKNIRRFLKGFSQILTLFKYCSFDTNEWSQVVSQKILWNGQKYVKWSISTLEWPKTPILT